MNENKLHIANGSPFTHFTYEEKAIAAPLQTWQKELQDQRQLMLVIL
jgi:hypothetical protein